MDGSTLGILKGRLDGGLSSLDQCKASLLMAEGSKLGDLSESFQHKPFYDSNSMITSLLPLA